MLCDAFVMDGPFGGHKCDHEAKFAMQNQRDKTVIRKLCGTHRNRMLRKGWLQLPQSLELYFKVAVTISADVGDPIERVTAIEAALTEHLGFYGDHVQVSLSNTRDRTGEG